MTPLVSIIIPTYNREGYIAEAIESALDQTCADIEVIVVDDGSTDGTRCLVAAYGDRVRYLTTPHSGVAHARNVGTRAARGRFLTFLDSDDRLYPYAAELLSSVLGRRQEAAFACAEMSGFDDRGFFERYHLRTYHRSTYRDSAMTFERVFGPSCPLAETIPVPGSLRDDPERQTWRVHAGRVFDLYLTNLVVAQNTVMLRSEAAREAGERQERLPYWEEVDFLLRICRQHPICFVNVPTYQLRYHPDQVSSTAGHDGKYVWMRKQQALVRTIAKHATADTVYYQTHRSRLDRQLARLYRAAAVPMLLAEGHSHRTASYARRARVYLAQSARLGAVAPALTALSYLPGPVRRLGVTAVERVRWFRSTYRLVAA